MTSTGLIFVRLAACKDSSKHPGQSALRVNLLCVRRSPSVHEHQLQQPLQRTTTNQHQTMRAPFQDAAFLKAYKLGTRLQGHYQEAQEAADWLAHAIHVCEAGECGAHLDRLISVGSKHLVALEICESVVASNEPVSGLTVSVPVGLMHFWIGRWRAAAAEAAALGMSGDIPYQYWQKNIELPEVVIKAQKWFDTAEKLIKKVAVTRLVKFTNDGERHIEAVEACRSSWPRFRHRHIQHSFVKWNMMLVEWCEFLESTASELVQAEKPHHVATMELIAQQLDIARDGLEDALVEELKIASRMRKADRLKKRTCSHCGKTAPITQISFAYCGGCRNSGVARIDLPRYCSEACQHAHWHAGHKHECPCAKDL